MSQNATVFDVAAYITQQVSGCTHMKLQKLVYYSQAWSLVWDEQPLFSEPIQAWANGPVVPTLFRKLQGRFAVKQEDLKSGDPARLTDQQRETVDAVIAFYAQKPPQWLSDLTHAETPWIEARRGLPPGERGRKVITWASMANYYSSL